MRRSPRNPRAESLSLLPAPCLAPPCSLFPSPQVDQAGSTVFYNVTHQDSIKLKVVERSGLTSANDKLGRMDVTVGEVISSYDINRFTGERRGLQVAEDNQPTSAA